MNSKLVALVFLLFGYHVCDEDDKYKNVLWEEVRYAHNLDMGFVHTRLTTLFKHQTVLYDDYLVPYVPTLDELRYVLKKPMKKLRPLNYTIEMNWERIRFVEKYYMDEVKWWPLVVKIHIISNVFRNKTTEEVCSFRLSSF
uniref:Uncharacterized protein n=1 Tax=Cacopsylla melanoneura TaxID=428564 RepID=A0A8D9EBI6_9HEMI